MRPTLRILLAVYLGLVLVITCWPSPEQTAAPRWADAVLEWSVARGVPLTFEVTEAVANVVMLVPFGVLVMALLRSGDGPRQRRTFGTAALVVAGAAGFSAAIETVQRILPGRVSTVQDVVLNTTGAAVGVALVGAAVGLRRLSDGRASRRASRASGR